MSAALSRDSARRLEQSMSVMSWLAGLTELMTAIAVANGFAIAIRGTRSFKAAGLTVLTLGKDKLTLIAVLPAHASRAMKTRHRRLGVYAA